MSTNPIYSYPGCYTQPMVQQQPVQGYPNPYPQGDAYVNRLNAEIYAKQLETRCVMLKDMLEADDVSLREKEVIRPMYDADLREWNAYKQQINVS